MTIGKCIHLIIFIIKSQKIRKASEIIKSFGANVLETLKEKKYVYIAEIEFSSLSNHDSDIRSRSYQLYNKLLNLFEKVVSKGIKQGEFKDLDIRKTAMIILAVFQGVNWFVVFDDNSVSASDYINSSIDLILQSISK